MPYKDKSQAAANQKAKYEALKNAGMCSRNCGKQAMLGFTICVDCSSKNTEMRRRNRRKNICECGKIKEDPKKHKCKSCLVNHLSAQLTRQKIFRDKGFCTHCGGFTEIGFMNCSKCRNKAQNKALELKIEVLSQYGGLCECCEETTLCFLSIDHINNDGKIHRQKVGTHIYIDLKKSGYPDGYRVLCFNCNSACYYTGECPHIIQSNIPYKDRFYYQDKQAAFKAYGNCCQCCGESNERFLTIDHINNNGSEERQKINSKGGSSFYRWLRQNNYPEGYQTLCNNCNQGKKFCGRCPHQLPIIS